MTNPSRNQALEVAVIHGPNLNLLGKREPKIYGRTTLAEIDDRLTARGRELGLRVATFQSNHEGEIVEKIQSCIGRCRALIINPAAYTHTSVAIRDALQMFEAPILEVHLSNVERREAFRRRSLVADVASGRICGLGAEGYLLALEYLARILRPALPALPRGK